MKKVDPKMNLLNSIKKGAGGGGAEARGGWGEGNGGLQGPGRQEPRHQPGARCANVQALLRKVKLLASVNTHTERYDTVRKMMWEQILQILQFLQFYNCYSPSFLQPSPSLSRQASPSSSSSSLILLKLRPFSAYFPHSPPPFS